MEKYLSTTGEGGGRGEIFIYATKFTRITPLLRTKENNSEIYKLKWEREKKQTLNNYPPLVLCI